MQPQLTNDKYLDYYIVVESDTPSGAKDFRLLNDTQSNYLRFYACLQTFGKRNRNRRLWTSQILKEMIKISLIPELLVSGSFVGEEGHPIPDSGQVTMERILSINPGKVSHRIVDLKWENDNKLCGVVETMDDGPGQPGDKLKRNMLQGVIPAFSLRSIVPQRQNPDGSIDVTGPGRLVCYDRVYGPSHQEAYMEKSVPVKNVITQPKFDQVMESFASFVIERSFKVNKIIDKMDPVLESATVDKNGILGMTTGSGIVFIAPERKFREDIASYMKNL